MWNEMITSRVIELIVKKSQSPFREPTLILLDSYGTHLKFVQEKGEWYEQRKVFLKVIPAKMTGMLQPLDVAVNRSFQQKYNDLYNEHMTVAINSVDPAARTKSGNVKMPAYLQISDWILEWAGEQPAEKIAKAFDVCGLVHVDEFSLEKLHKPLRDCFDENFSLASWENAHREFTEEENIGIEEEPISVKIFTEAFSMFKSLYALIEDDDGEDYDYWLTKTLESVKNFITQDDILSSIFTEEERDRFDSGSATGSGVEFSAAAAVLEIHLKLIEIDKDVTTVAENDYNIYGTRKIELIMFEGNFGIREKLDAFSEVL